MVAAVRNAGLGFARIVALVAAEFRKETGV